MRNGHGRSDTLSEDTHTHRPASRSINNTLPERLRFILENKDHPQANRLPYDVAFPMEPGMFSIWWHTVQGEDRYDASSLGPQYTELVEFIRKNAHSRQHTSQTVFGPNASYFTFSPHGYSWQHLPRDLKASIKGRMNLGRPTCVALGVHGSFVVLFEDGVRIFEGLRHYPAVNELIRKREGIAYISLNPHEEGMYYAVCGDGSASWSLPDDWERAVKNVCSAISSPPRSPTVGWNSPHGSPPPSWNSPHGSPPLGLHSRTPSFHASPPGFLSHPPAFHSPPPNFQLPSPILHSPPPSWHSPASLVSYSPPVGALLGAADSLVSPPRMSWAMFKAVEHIWSAYAHQSSAASNLGNNFAATGSGSPQALLADPSGNAANDPSNAFFADPGNNMPVDPNNVPDGAFLVDPNMMQTGAFMVDPSNMPPQGSFIFDPSNVVPSGFDPSSLTDFAGGLDPGILGSFIGALDPSSVLDGIATIFGN
ncbi:hypothetical protein FB45DRAFT_930551 [Roridomyces roridus]|uniref:Uncharacterized protein n=1 Tax=Roridomyces roridus TaxID=1738132 RepID=A0AAD7BFB8_9AGAR|nr:hypothetical protein FB45DRAFT_930551 [Roridomyces roridus]